MVALVEFILHCLCLCMIHCAGAISQCERTDEGWVSVTVVEFIVHCLCLCMIQCAGAISQCERTDEGWVSVTEVISASGSCK